MIGNGKPGVNDFGTNVTLDTFNNRVFNHEVFSISKRFSLASEANLKILIDPTEKGVFPKNEFVVLPLVFKGFNAGPLNIDLYVGTDSTTVGSTLWGSIDRNFVNPVSAHTVVRANPTINDLGALQPVEFSVFSNGVSAATSIGGESKEDLLFKGDPSLRYLLQITNADAAKTASGIFVMNWFES